MQGYTYNKIGDKMIINYTSNERDLLARLMRSEALGEGGLGMLMVGNVVVNRVLADCYTFTDIDTLYKAIFQSPGGFSGTSSSLFYGSPTNKERQLANRILKGEYYYPATNALWFYSNSNSCKSTWYEQPLAGRYKNHCFYMPEKGACNQLH